MSTTHDPSAPVVIDRAEWESLNGVEKVWVIATRAVERGLPADFMPASGPDRTSTWVAEHIGLSEHGGRAFAFMFGLTLQMGAIFDGSRQAWTPGARLPPAERVPDADLSGYGALARLIVDAVRAECAKPDPPVLATRRKRST